ncbi:MAG: 4-hydroxythreonine-4-phosphate dehydrogenase PdxA [Bacteroidaceae bacterium]|nr:4-hydroxythreonine-4-phosphate dehydrogenase PdxA [Bacteroidaceae bacterium]
MDNMNHIRVGITHGDTNGVGYELIFKTFSEPAILELFTPIVYGSPKAAAYHRKAIDLHVDWCVVSSAAEAQPGKLNMVACFEEEVNIELGQPTPDAGRAALRSIDRAIDEYKKGWVDVLVTAPVNKATIQNCGCKFTGHTEYIQEKLGGEDEALMILLNENLRVALTTTHLPLKDVAAAITRENVEKKIRIFYHSLRHDFLIPAPRIAVLALNPHSGDSGLLGAEEKESIRPAIDAMVEEGIQCFGPYPADGFFGAGMYTHFDGILAMYHDQGLAPFKALSDGDGVNFTAGLPIVRTSPDHGTAYDIAGQGVAEENSFRQAIYMAIDIFRNRKIDAEAHANPLRKQYHEKREDGDRQRHMTAPQPQETPAE